MTADAHAPTLDGCFPHLAATRRATDHIDEGWDCAVVVLDRDLVVRLPRRVEVQEPLRTEARFLDLLGRVTDVPAPRPVQVCEAHGSMVYRLLPGAPLGDGVLDRVGEHLVASQVAAVLRAVWNLPVDDAVALGVPHRDLGPTLRDFRRRVLPLADHAEAERVLDEASATLLQRDGPTVIHADLGPAHLLCDDEGAVGVIDWSDVCIGDPATDLAWLLNGSARRLRRPLIEGLELDAATVARADLFHRLGPWWEVVHGLDQRQPHVVDSGLEGIRSRLLA